MPITCDCVPTPREFSYGNSTPEIPIGDLRTKIEDREYYQDQTISDMELPRCLSIGSEGFRESSITSIDAPKCKTIGNYAFYGCNGLSPDMDFSSVEEIGSYAFAGQNNLRGTGLLDFSSVKIIKNNAFELYHRNYSTQPWPIILIPNVEEIGDSAFNRAGHLHFPDDELNLPKCKKIGVTAFNADVSEISYNLKKIYLPAIEEIGNYAFRRLDSVLEEVHFGPNCTKIGRAIFYDTYSSNWRLYVEAITPPILGGLGEDVNQITIYVPESSVNAYKAASGWSTYSSRIYPIPT